MGKTTITMNQKISFIFTGSNMKVMLVSSDKECNEAWAMHQCCASMNIAQSIITLSWNKEFKVFVNISYNDYLRP
jgi:phosphoribosyl 1,2-cyclic phosphodiesterase